MGSSSTCCTAMKREAPETKFPFILWKEWAQPWWVFPVLFAICGRKHACMLSAKWDAMEDVGWYTKVWSNIWRKLFVWRIAILLYPVHISGYLEGLTPQWLWFCHTTPALKYPFNNACRDVLSLACAGAQIQHRTEGNKLQKRQSLTHREASTVKFSLFFQQLRLRLWSSIGRAADLTWGQ